MRLRRKLEAAGLGAVAALLLSACGGSDTIRVYVEPTYEQNHLQKLLALHREVRVLAYPGTEDVRLRVEGVEERGSTGLPKAAIHARHRETGYEAYAVAEFLRVQNSHGGRARWVASFTDGVRVNDIDEILFQVVRAAALGEGPNKQITPEEIERALHSRTPAS